jgi:metal-responsive CopG/Arc/MetJ family transcriptional regulator
MMGTSIKLNKELMEKVKKCADAAGYSSPQEFVEHVLERELAKVESSASDEEIARKLQGLGYLDAGIDI